MKKVFERDLSRGGFNLKVNSDTLDQLMEDTGVESADKETIKLILEHLFQDSKKEQDRRSIINADKFDIYFDNLLNTEGILFRDFTPVLEKQWSKIKSKVETWISEGKEAYLIEILGNLDQFETRQKFEKITYIWITLVNLGIRSEFILNDWIQSISKNKDKMDVFYGVDKDFFFSLFRPNKGTFFYDTYAIRLLLRNYIDSKENFFFPLSQKELEDLSIERLEGFIRTRQTFDIRVFNNFYYNCWSGKAENDRVEILEKANELIRAYIDRFPDGYLRFTIRSKFTPHLDDIFVFEPFTSQYFKSWENFEKFLGETTAKNSEFETIVKYFADFKKNKYSEFHAAPPPMWIEIDAVGNSTFKYFKEQTFNSFLIEIRAMVQ